MIYDVDKEIHYEFPNKKVSFRWVSARKTCLSCTNPPICQIDTKIQQFEISVSVLELFLKDIQFCVHSYIDEW